MRARLDRSRTSVPSSCPDCDARLRVGVSERHSVGPGPAARVVEAIAVLLAGLSVYVAAKMLGSRWFGYGIALPPIVVLVAGHWIAGRFPRTWRLRCRKCRWSAELPAGEAAFSATPDAPP